MTRTDPRRQHARRAAHPRAIRYVELGVAVLVTMLVAAGCSDPAAEQSYADRLEPALATRNDVIAKLDGGRLRGETAYLDAAADVTRTIDELEADDVPRRYRAGHETFIDALDALGALLARLGRCEALEARSAQDARACRGSISQDVFDGVRNDFRESDAIYRTEGLSLPGLGGAEQDDVATGGDTLDAGSEDG